MCIIAFAAAWPALQDGDTAEEHDSDPEQCGVQAAVCSGGGLFYLDTGTSDHSNCGVRSCVSVVNDDNSSNDNKFHDAAEDLANNDTQSLEAPTAYGITCYCELPVQVLIVYKPMVQCHNFGCVFLACLTISCVQCDFFMWADGIEQCEA